MNIKTLLELNANEEAYIVDICAGRGLYSKLESLGIIKGQKITKLSSLNFKGPQVICVDRVQIAIGRGIAQKIKVRSVQDDPLNKAETNHSQQSNLIKEGTTSNLS